MPQVVGEFVHVDTGDQLAYGFGSHARSKDVRTKGIAQLAIASLPAGQFEIMAFDGTTSATDAVETDMIFLNVAYRGKYLLTDEDVGILGRDVLASIVLLLDGPNQEWSAR